MYRNTGEGVQYSRGERMRGRFVATAGSSPHEQSYSTEYSVMPACATQQIQYGYSSTRGAYVWRSEGHSRNGMGALASCREQGDTHPLERAS